jgi:GTPase
MSTPSQSNAVLVAIHTPHVTGEELESSLQELTRLVKTLGYHVVGRQTKTQFRQIRDCPGQGKLTELALWTGGSGTVGASYKRPMHKAASKREAAEVDVCGGIR